MTTESAPHAERTHSLLGFSQAHRYLKCTGSVFYAANTPPEPPNEFAEWGTRAHEYLEILLGDFLEHKLMGSDPDIRTHLMTNVDPEIRDIAEIARDAIWKQGLQESITGKAYGIEERLALDTALALDGTCDFWTVGIDDRGKRSALVVDFKTGYRVVSEHRNPQLAGYAAALRREIRALGDGRDVDYVRGAIVQPRADAPAWRETVFTSSQLDTWEKRFKRAAHQIFVKKKPIYKPGEWCTYCPGSGRCAAQKKYLETATSLALVRTTTLPPVSSLPDEQLRRIIEAKDEVTDFLKACYAHALKRHYNGDPVGGLKVVRGVSRRKWKEETEEIGAALLRYGVEPWDTEPRLKTITVIERALKKLNNGGEELLATLTEKSVASDIVVPDSDPREAVQSYDDLLTKTIEVTHE